MARPPPLIPFFRSSIFDFKEPVPMAIGRNSGDWEVRNIIKLRNFLITDFLFFIYSLLEIPGKQNSQSPYCSLPTKHENKCPYLIIC
jgi:hypothetical protein